MTEQPAPKFQFPPEMRGIAEESVAQAQRAFEGWMTATQGAVSAWEGQATAAHAGIRDMQRKAVLFAQQNVKASFDLAQRLVAAKDPAELSRLHADYVKTQIHILNEQARELGQTAAKTAAGVPKD